MAKPDDDLATLKEAERNLFEVGVTCDKLKMRGDACHGCPDNPLSGTDAREDKKAIDLHQADLMAVDSLYTAARLNMLTLRDLTWEEFEMLKTFSAEMDALHPRLF